jgi:protein gp37
MSDTTIEWTDKAQATEQRVPFFKQWGGFPKKKAGRELDGRTFDAMPELTRAAYPGRAEVAARKAAAL